MLLFLLLTTSCEKDAKVQPRRYPFVIMKEIKTTESGAEFYAEIEDLGTSPILTCGFLWSNSPDFRYNQYSFGVERENAARSFSLQVNSDLRKDTSYTVRPFIQTKDFLVYGNSMAFKSTGSLPPKIICFEPLKGDNGDTIVISGENFSVSKSRVKVLFGQDVATIISTSFNEIKVALPQRLSLAGKVPVSVKSGEYQIEASERFTIVGHEVNDFTPKEGIIGETAVEITGKGFDNTRSVVWFGDNKADIINISETRIVAKLPFSMKTGSVSIKVDIGGKKAVSDSTFTVKSRWKRLKDFPGEPRVLGSVEVAGNYCYLLAGVKNHSAWNSEVKDFWRYDVSNDQWLKLADFPGTKRSNAASFIINGEIYFGLGVNMYARLSDFWKYNIQTDTWTQLKNFPGSPRYDAIHYTLNSKGYIVGGYSGDPNSDVWQYEPVSDTWTKLYNVYSSYLDSRSPFCQNVDKAYLIPRAYATLYEFSPGEFLTGASVSLPATIYGDYLPAFILNGKFYILSNYNNTNAVFWNYDFPSNKWTRLEDFPGGCRLFNSYYSLNGSVYIMFGSKLGYSESSPDIWVYNPDN